MSCGYPTLDRRCEHAVGTSASVSATAGALAGQYPGASQFRGKVSGRKPARYKAFVYPPPQPRSAGIRPRSGIDPPAEPLPCSVGTDPEQVLFDFNCHLPTSDTSATSSAHVSSDYLLQVGGHAAAPASPLAFPPDGPIETAAGDEVPEPSALAHFPSDNQTSRTPSVCSDSVHHVGGLAAAITSPHDFNAGAGKFVHAPLKCTFAGVLNPACDSDDALPTEALVDRHVLLAPPATASIFERSALLSNLQRGPLGASVGRASGLRPKATAYDFEHLSALALASEKAQSNSVGNLSDEHFDSGLLGRTDWPRFGNAMR